MYLLYVIKPSQNAILLKLLLPTINQEYQKKSQQSKMILKWQTYWISLGALPLFFLQDLVYFVGAGNPHILFLTDAEGGHSVDKILWKVVCVKKIVSCPLHNIKFPQQNSVRQY